MNMVNSNLVKWQEKFLRLLLSSSDESRRLWLVNTFFGSVIPNMSDYDRLNLVNASVKHAGWTPLMSAAENNNLEACIWLLENGANVNLAMRTGWTALHAASKNGHNDIIQYLLEKGANPDFLATHRKYGRQKRPIDVADNAETFRVFVNYKMKKAENENLERSYCSLGEADVGVPVQDRHTNTDMCGISDGSHNELCSLPREGNPI